MTREERILDILDKWEFFFGQRAGRELWADKPDEVQNQDIADFNRDVQLVRSALREQPRWISVEERLPDDTLKGFPVVVCIQNRWNDRRCEVVYWWGSERMWRWQDVTHWMPLPEPPEVKV